MRINNLILLLVYCGASFGCFGQTDSLNLSSGAAGSNGAVALTLNLASPAQNEPAAIQWTLAYAPTDVTSISVTAGSAATAAGKTLNCFGGSGTYTCLAFGTNVATISNGAVAVVN